MSFRNLPLFPAVIFLFFISHSLQAQDYLEGTFWKQQAIEDIIIPWTEHAIDQEYGAYHTFLNQAWEPYNGSSKFPGMIARHLFSYSVAYLLSGEEKYLQQARETYHYLIQHGWDPKYGGWYHELDRSGHVINDEKDLFMQTYAITGLTLYFLVTRDAGARNYIDRSIRMLEDHAWDGENDGGYVASLHRDLRIKKTEKRFSPQLAPLSGYLLFLYAVTHEKKYLRMSERIMETVLEHMYDEKSGWIMEGFEKDWRPLDEGNDWMNTGHNIEVAWMLLRLYQFNGKEAYKQQAMTLNKQLLQYAFDKKSGIWYHKVKLDDPQVHSDDSPWWVQAYGNMFQLYLYHLTGESTSFHYYQKGAEFWSKHFIDHRSGGAYLSVGADGAVINGDKAVRTKTSYHAMEHGMLNYLYLDFWVHQKGVKLYFYIENSGKSKFYPLLIEDMDYRIEEVLVRGKPWKKFNQKKGYVTLPSGSGIPLMIILRDRQ